MATKKENEQIAQLQTDMNWVKKVLANHLQHHFLMSLAAWGTALSALIALIIKLISG